MTDRRATFVPLVGAGLAAGALAAVAGARPWVVDPSVPRGSDPFGEVSEAGEMPLALALALVALACWGVVLVTRRRVRRVVLALAALASAGLLTTVAVGLRTLPDQVLEAAPTGGETPGGMDPTSTTGWLWVAAGAGLVLLVAAVLALSWSSAWPEMSSRYDAPGREAAPRAPAEEQSSLDLWKSLDEGRDPTA
ncbi:Trp biosynthesis-associated membrane protein [Nocardioides coralli]|uniref:Trp biosynthesis-associated membrane protein n=1 Tax=Nocardioides coralli TaxID=2872154 RepID=UPI001CA45E73|nr:Trp biosynthesis-associated membrane protein [Nocardioides coralli]QZY27923.1 Trp biosynthesis-associated membrane protein [Nocardioides coralli]